jgi:hypothetical protein
LTFRIGPQRPDLVRYNRVEGLSLGVRAQIRPNSTSYTATVRMGLADLHVNARLDAVTENLDWRFVTSVHHELAAIDERARHFGVANSLMALAAGQDDGDYYRRTGTSMELTPPTASARTFRVRTTVELQRAVHNETRVQLARLWDDSVTFRPNLDADRAVEVAASLELGHRWGTDPRQVRGGLDAFAQAAVVRQRDDTNYFSRASVASQVAFPLPGRMSFSLEAEGGTSWGSPTRQRLWYLGGPMTLRGHDPRSAGGGSFGRGRVELDRAFSFGRLVLFSDVGWAGDRADIDLDDSLAAAGAGLAVIDGILRIDGAWRLDDSRRFRLDVYLDQIL